MQSDRWQRVKAIFAIITDVPLSDRTALLDHECGDDVDLRREVESLLRAAATATDQVSVPGHQQLLSLAALPA